MWSASTSNMPVGSICSGWKLTSIRTNSARSGSCKSKNSSYEETARCRLTMELSWPTTFSVAWMIWTERNRSNAELKQKKRHLWWKKFLKTTTTLQSWSATSLQLTINKFIINWIKALRRGVTLSVKVYPWTHPITTHSPCTVRPIPTTLTLKWSSQVRPPWCRISISWTRRRISILSLTITIEGLSALSKRWVSLRCRETPWWLKRQVFTRSISWRSSGSRWGRWEISSPQQRRLTQIQCIRTHRWWRWNRR